jgi:hypothetical protein
MGRVRPAIYTTIAKPDQALSEQLVGARLNDNPA